MLLNNDSETGDKPYIEFRHVSKSFDDLLVLDDALKSLEKLDPQQSRIVEMRFFGGLSIEEVAEVLDISSGTVKRGWAMARAWLHQEITL